MCCNLTVASLSSARTFPALPEPGSGHNRIMDVNSSSDEDNKTEGLDSDGVRIREWIYVHFAAVLLLALVALVGNVLVITVIAQTRSLHTTTSVFIIALSISDLCTSLTVMLPSAVIIMGANYNHHLCGFLGFCYIQFRMASIIALSTISIERFTAIQAPLKYATLVTKQRTAVTVSLVGIIPLVMATMPFTLGLDYAFSRTKGLCVPAFRENLAYALVVLCGGVCVPLFITLIMYCCIANVAYKQAKRGVIVCDENHCQYVPSRKGELKAVRTSCAITGKSVLDSHK